MKKSIIYIALLFSFFSCEEKAESPEPEPVDLKGAVVVLKENSGYDTVMNVVAGLSSATAAPPGIFVSDFSIETNNNFNIVYYTEFPSQQSVLASYTRFSKNLTTQAVIPLPQNADNLKNLSPAQIGQDGYTLTKQEFKPYSNYFTYVVQRGGSFNFKNVIEFRGDISARIESFNPIGVPDMGYYYPVANIGGTSKKDNAFGNFTSGVLPPTYPSYLFRVCNPYPFTFLNKGENRIIQSVLESRIGSLGNPTAFTIRTDSLLVNEVNITTSAQTLVTKIKLDNISATNNFIVQRHYSTNGSIISILLKDETANKYWTFSYNFTTKTLTKGLENAALDYSDVGSDIDLDEFGNIYYSGYADNGANRTGVSIYQKGINGQTTRIGADNFLKFGTIIKLKYMLGKVYIALNGKKTGTSEYQLTIIKQN